MIQVGFLLLLCIAAVTAGAPAPPALASCVASITAATNFDPKLLEGKWYEVRKIASVPERQGTCEAAKCKANPDRSLNVDLGWVDTKNKKQKISGTITPTGAKLKDAQFTVKLGEKSAIYTIFHLEDKFFGAYSCMNNQAYVWVFAKAKEVSDTTLAPVTKAMTGLNAKSLKVSSQTGCQDVLS